MSGAGKQQETAGQEEPQLELELDHLVVAATRLEEGVAHVANRLGISPAAFSPEGKHALMGTHNRLLGLGGSCYLEVIAVNPAAAPPGRPRWFGLDSPAVQARLRSSPAVLLHWVARLRPGSAADLSALEGQQPHRVPPVVAMRRGEFCWRICVPHDGSLPNCGCDAGVVSGGLLPTLIQWDVRCTPAEVLPPSGIRLVHLTGRHPQPQQLTDSLAALGAGALISIDEAPAAEPQLVAEFETPDRVLTLE